MIRRWMKPLGIAAFAFALLTPAALASDGSTATVTGGDLTITNPAAGDFAVTLDGTAKAPTTSLAAFSVTDATGTGAGWHVTAQATRFANAGATKQLALGSLQMSAPTVAANGTTSPAPTVGAGPFTIDSGSAATIASAALDQGMGVYDFGATTLTLSLPANVYADTYTSTVTISAITAP